MYKKIMMVLWFGEETIRFVLKIILVVLPIMLTSWVIVDYGSVLGVVVGVIFGMIYFSTFAIIRITQRISTMHGIVDELFVIVLRSNSTDKDEDSHTECKNSESSAIKRNS